jgi:hypothetical protein
VTARILDALTADTATAILFLGHQRAHLAGFSRRCFVRLIKLPAKRQRNVKIYLSSVRPTISLHPPSALARATTGPTPVSVVSTEEASTPLALFPCVASVLCFAGRRVRRLVSRECTSDLGMLSQHAAYITAARTDLIKTAETSSVRTTLGRHQFRITAPSSDCRLG